MLAFIMILFSFAQLQHALEFKNIYYNHIACNHVLINQITLTFHACVYRNSKIFHEKACKNTQCTKMRESPIKFLIQLNSFLPPKRW